ncbi:MAG: YkvA family protein [Myxococcota bacterium]|nr:DUF1232 domain-containing protein [Myxococcales bacterium]
MATQSFKVVFTLDDDDRKYFRGLVKAARKAATSEDESKIVDGAKQLVARMRGAAKTPTFVLEAVAVLEDLTAIIEDGDYAAPRAVRDRVLGALAYFANPGDLIPDDVPVFGFLDDALMIKLVEQEFRHELWAFRKFRTFRDGAEQRPWTQAARDRLPKRLADKRSQLRAAVDLRHKRDATRSKLFG